MAAMRALGEIRRWLLPGRLADEPEEIDCPLTAVERSMQIQRHGGAKRASTRSAVFGTRCNKFRIDRRSSATRKEGWSAPTVFRRGPAKLDACEALVTVLPLQESIVIVGTGSVLADRPLLLTGAAWSCGKH
jgi:hypothetical protein